MRKKILSIVVLFFFSCSYVFAEEIRLFTMEGVKNPFAGAEDSFDIRMAAQVEYMMSGWIHHPPVSKTDDRPVVPSVIVGHSMGGLRALAYAGAVSQRVDQPKRGLRAVITIGAPVQGHSTLLKGRDVINHQIGEAGRKITKGIALIVTGAVFPFGGFVWDAVYDNVVIPGVGVTMKNLLNPQDPAVRSLLDGLFFDRAAVADMRPDSEFMRTYVDNIVTPDEGHYETVYTGTVAYSEDGSPDTYVTYTFQALRNHTWTDDDFGECSQWQGKVGTYIDDDGKECDQWIAISNPQTTPYFVVDENIPDIPRIAPDIATGYIVCQDRSILGMAAGESGWDVRGIVDSITAEGEKVRWFGLGVAVACFAAAVAFGFCFDFVNAAGATIAGISMLWNVNDIDRCLEITRDIDGWYAGVVGSPESDCLIPVGDQYRHTDYTGGCPIFSKEGQSVSYAPQVNHFEAKGLHQRSRDGEQIWGVGGFLNSGGKAKVVPGPYVILEEMFKAYQTAHPGDVINRDGDVIQ